jgi:hypothetical protein
MKSKNSLEEVREWKHTIYKTDKELSSEKFIDQIRAETGELKKLLGLLLYQNQRVIIQEITNHETS